MEFLRELLAKFEIEVEGAEDIENASSALDEGAESAEGFSFGIGTIVVAAAAAAAAIGGATFAVFSFVEATTSAVDETGKLSTTLGIQTATIQKWGFVAGEAGGSMSDVSATMRRLSKNMFEAQRTAGPAREAFEKLGVEWEDNEGNLRSLEDVLLDSATAIGSTENNAEKLALAQETLGRGALKLIPGFKGTREEMQAALETAGELNGVISDEFIKGSEEFNDNVAQMGNQIFALRAIIATTLLPVVKFVVQGIRDMTASISEWLKETQIIDRVVRFGGIGTLAAAVKLMTTGLGGWVVNWRTVGQLISRVWVVLRPILGAIARFAIWALILDDIITFLIGGESKLGDFIDAAFGVGTAVKIQQALNDAWDLTVALFTSAKEAIDVFFEALENGDSIWDAATEAAMTWATSIGDFIRDNVGAELKAVFDQIVSIIELVTGGALEGLGETLFNAEDERLNREAILRAQDAARPGNGGARRPTVPGGRGGNSSVVDQSQVNVNLQGKQTPETVRTASREAQQIARARGGRQRTANAVVRGRS